VAISPYQRDLVIVNPAGQVLLQRRSDDGEWGLPGGALEPGEEPAEALVREIREETALEVVPERIVGVYAGPDFFVRYPNGDEAAILSITLRMPSGGGGAPRQRR
jgi:8-oxo-dGTP pyrophosphatase MutT (NUDIX family)